MKIRRILLGILLLIIAANGFGGGYYGMSGAKSVPVEWLEGSPFRSYFIPSLFLFVVIGGLCLAGAIAAFRNTKHTRPLAFLCAGVLFCWILVQVAIIGYVSWMQPAIFIAAVCITILAYCIKSKKEQY